MAGRVSSGEGWGLQASETLLPLPQTVTAAPPGPRAMPAAKTHGWDAACANPASRAPTASSAPQASMALAASVSAAPTLSSCRSWEPIPSPTEHGIPSCSVPVLQPWSGGWGL